VPFKRDPSPETNEEGRRDARIYQSNLDVEQASLGSSSSSQPSRSVAVARFDSTSRRFVSGLPSRAVRTAPISLPSKLLDYNPVKAPVRSYSMAIIGLGESSRSSCSTRKNGKWSGDLGPFHVNLWNAIIEQSHVSNAYLLAKSRAQNEHVMPACVLSV